MFPLSVSQIRMDEKLSSKRYEPPTIDLDNQNSGHTYLINLTGFNKNVLEIGTSTGYISKILKNRGNTVVGIEIDHEAGIIAQQNCDRMIIGDVETLDLEKKLEPASFDVILCGDVLEHLKMPARILKKLHTFLKPEGYLVVSLPNFCHGDVLLNLFYGDFRYTPMGLLDETHLRFFGLKNIYTLFAKCGYQIADLHTTNLEIGNTELRINNEKIPQDLLKFIRSLPNSNVYQFIFIAYPTSEVKIPEFNKINLNELFFNSLEESEKKIQTPLLHELSVKEQQLQEITTKIIELSKHAHNIEAIVADRENQISDLSKHAHNLEAIVADRENQISDLSKHAHDIEVLASERQNQITELTIHNQCLMNETNSIKLSITYQLSRKFHQGIIERFLPQYSRRRKLYDRGLKAGRILINDKRKKGVGVTNKDQVEKANPSITSVNKEESDTNTAKEKTDTTSDISEIELNDKLHVFLSETESRLVFPNYKTPVVSIIILTFNKSSYTYQCLISILKYSDVPYEVIIVDNGSTDSTNELLNRIDCSIQIKNPKNLGFIQGCNAGAKKATGKYLLFLNNDTVVTGTWLSRLVRTMETYQNCGAVGCKLVWPNGQLQEAGSIIWRDGSALGYGRGDNPSKPEYSYVREIDFCSGACLLVCRDLFFELNGFDERFIPAYYEDSDLCLGIKNLGFNIVYQPDVTIYHHEFTSSSKELAQKIMQTNQIKFIEKWEEYLPMKKNPSLDNLLDARDIQKGKKILYLDDRIPASDQGSGYPRANKILTYLKELGNTVTFYPLDNTTPWQPYTRDFQQSGIEIFYGENLDFLSFARQRSGYYDIIFVSRPHNFEKTYDIIKSCFPDSKLIYDAEALFSTREILLAKIKGKSLSNDMIREIQSKEIELMRKADCIITVSENEKRTISENSGLTNIIVFGYPTEIQKNIPPFNARNDILFVGSFLAPDGPNDDAVIHFINDIWPKVHQNLSCKLFIVGIHPPVSIQKLATSSIIVTGYVDNLQEYYNKCRIFIVPHRFAAGISLKLVEAMSYGIPSVVSELIASQMDISDGQEVLVARNSEEFAEKIIQLYQREELWKEIQTNSNEYIRRTCSPQNLKNDLGKITNNSFEDI